MNQVSEQFACLEREIASERGDFALFALVRPEAQELEIWDLVIAATWAESLEELESLMLQRISTTFSNEALFQLARVVPVPADDPAVQALLAEYPVEHGRLRVEDDTFLGLPITKAYIITARPDRPAVPA